MREVDVLVIGCGIAGVITALRLAQQSDRRRILVITRTHDRLQSSSDEAQGGIAGCGEDDSPELLTKDILSAGDQCGNEAAIRVLAEEGPRLLQEVLVDLAEVEFDRDANDQPCYGLEAAHSRRRILHVGDSTGHAIMAGIMAKLGRMSNVVLETSYTAVDLITFPHHAVKHAVKPDAIYGPVACHGAYILDRRTGKVERCLATRTVLATGGLGGLYLHTSNRASARGDGIAMASRAGARIINAEYIQFHPTTLCKVGAPNFLISEAVRGEGGVLLTPDGRTFMHRYSSKLRDLAPRDLVARAIHSLMLSEGYPHVLLDIASKRSASYIESRFPTIRRGCLRYGLDIAREPIPVVPAAHYSCGGVWVDLWGRTSVEGLHAVGEVSCTGVHGANRLASTSLLEGLVWGDRVARHIGRIPDFDRPPGISVRRWETASDAEDIDPALIQADLLTLRSLMWRYVGLIRNERLLSRAVRELSHSWQAIEESYRAARPTDELVGLRNGVQAGLLIARSARRNKRSLGTHYRDDSSCSHGMAREIETRHDVEAQNEPQIPAFLLHGNRR